ncbi:ROK family protein [Sediminibacillus halophilus]|uniref:Sugar kinase of the NBD/HSP70 family, may contain an N-terminal HTH domain n=1 Tax=Sediminibacillus halophilus TaxID=482461 RepID=A0A1G9V823_9BACI|nr:ROK family protein [Sediminibacillus halophilus]SDM68240.1 Sugar kinase of the NBD/HSP70 family, may contain an N-terminal HTH domain [Sediminibacillus halophilus]
MKALRTGSKELIKEINRFKVLNIIRHQQPVSRAEISRQCELGVSTLSYIMDELKAQNLIYEVGEASSTGGRKAKLLKFNENHGYIVSIKIEEVQILIALTDMEGGILLKTYVPFEKHTTPEKIVSLIEREVKMIFSERNKDLSSLLGIGVLSSGLVNRHEGEIIRASMLGWENVPITEMIKERFPTVPVFVDNNINGYTLAELEKGEGQKDNNFLVVSIGAGLGLSIVIDRKIYYGAVGSAGEFGHTNLVMGGYSCHCGQEGCLEMYASEFYFENRYKEKSKEDSAYEEEDHHFSAVAKAAAEDDVFAQSLMKEMGTHLGYGLRNLINTLNPEKIIIVGEGVKYKHLFEKEVLAIANDNFFEKVSIDTDIVFSQLKDDSWFTGGALLAISQLFQEPIYEQKKQSI